MFEHDGDGRRIVAFGRQEPHADAAEFALPAC